MDLNRFFSRVVSKHRLWVFAGTLTVLAASWPAVKNLKVDGDFISLLNPGDKTVSNYVYVAENFSGTDAFVLLVEGYR